MKNPILFLALTFAVYYGAWLLQRKFKSIILNPVLITILIIISVLKLMNVEFEEYNSGGQFIEFWLKPAVVALGLPLFRQLDVIKRQFLPIFISQFIGSAIGIYSVALIAQWLGASHDVVLSLIPKSVTTPIAIEVSSQIGGIPAITAPVVVCVGILGSITGLKFLNLFYHFHDGAQGISVGTASHALGTARMFAVRESLGTYATLGLILNGILTSILAPLFIPLL